MSVVKTSMPASSSSSHVLPALGMARAGRVGVRQLVDQHQRRACAPARASRSNSLQRAAAVRRRSCAAACSRPASSAAVSLRPWVSTTPTSTSRPACARAARRSASRRSCRRRRWRRSRCAACRARLCASCCLHAAASRASGSGRWFGGRHGQVTHRRHVLHAVYAARPAPGSAASTLTRGSPRKPSTAALRCAASTSACTCVRRQARARGPRAPPGSGRGRADVRIEPAGRGRDQVDRHRRGVAGIGRAQRLDAALDRIDQRRVQRPQVRAAGGRGVVGHRRWWPTGGPRNARVAEGLADQRRADRSCRRCTIRLPRGLRGNSDLRRRR